MDVPRAYRIVLLPLGSVVKTLAPVLDTLEDLRERIWPRKPLTEEKRGVENEAFEPYRKQSEARKRWREAHPRESR
jgi:hypothetical protein